MIESTLFLLKNTERADTPIHTLLRPLLLATLVGACSASASNTHAGTVDASTDNSMVTDASINTTDSSDASVDDVADVRADIDHTLRVHLYATSSTTFAGNPIGLFANVTIGDSRVLTDNVGRLVIQGGDGNIGVRPYGRAGERSAVTMDHVCVETSGTHAARGIYEQRTSGNWNTVSVQAAPCDMSHQIDTGWSVAQFYAPNSVAQAQMNPLTVTVISLADQPMVSRTITVDEMARGTHVAITPATPVIERGSNFFAIVTAVDSSQPIVCSIAGLPITSNGEDGSNSGCNTDLNGPMNEWVRPQTAINRTNYADGWTLRADGITGCSAWSRGYGTVEASTPLLLSNLGGGMFLVGGTATTTGVCQFSANLNSGDQNYQSHIDLPVR